MGSTHALGQGAATTRTPDNLSLALSGHANGHWSAATIAAARKMRADLRTPNEWSAMLDRLAPRMARAVEADDALDHAAHARARPLRLV